MAGKSDFVIEGGELKQYRGDDAHVVIPEGVTAIGRLAFVNRFRMKTVSIPHSVTQIGDNAFRGCCRLESIAIPPRVTSILDQAFGDCRALKEVTIPDGITEISTGLFWQCSGLESVTLPVGVTRIGNVAFVTCYNLKHIAIPDGVKAIGNMAFKNCRALRSVTLPDGLEEIGAAAFEDCESLECVNIPDSVKKIGDRAFMGCRALKLANEPNCLPEIGQDAFKHSDSGAMAAFAAAERRNIPVYSGCIVTVTNLRRHRNADRLQCSTIQGHNVIVDGSCRLGQRLVYFPIGGQLDEAFARENHLLRGEGAEGQGGGYLHPTRRNVTALRLRGEISEGLALPVEVLGKYADIDALKDGDRVSTLGGRLICHIYIPDGMTYDFRKRTLTRYRDGKGAPEKMVVPWGTKAVGARAFMHCRRVTRVVLPETVTTIGERAFYDCPGLKRVVVPDSVARIGDEAFARCPGLAAIGLSRGLTHSVEGAFITRDFEITDGKLVKYRGEMRHVEIPEGVLEIGDHAFSNNAVIESVAIPAGVTKIGNRAFAYCKRLRSVSIPGSVGAVGDCAFLGCKSLRGVTLPPGVERIGDHAFGHYLVYRYEYGLKYPMEIYKRYWDFRIYCAKDSAAERYAGKELLACFTRLGQKRTAKESEGHA